MSKLKITAVLFAIIAMTAVSGVAKKNESELAMFAQSPDGTKDVSSFGTEVIVGTNVWTYSPHDISLYLSESLVADTEISPGGHWGRARCLKSNGPEGGRLDFYFDCLGGDLSTCTYRLIVRFGIYDRNADVVVFDPGSMLLYRTGPEAELLKDVDASFSIAFPADSGGDETATEKGGQCKDGDDNDGDGSTDCDDSDCATTKWCR